MKSTYTPIFTAAMLLAASCSDGGTENGSTHQAAEATPNADADEQGQSKGPDSNAVSDEDEHLSSHDQSREGSAQDHPTETGQSPEEALANDLAASAERKGWTIEEAEAYHAATEAVGDVAAQVAEARYPLHRALLCARFALAAAARRDDSISFRAVWGR